MNDSESKNLPVKDIRSEIKPMLLKLEVPEKALTNLRAVEYGDGGLSFDFGESSEETLRDEASWVSYETFAEHIYENLYPAPDDNKYSKLPNW